MRRHRRAHAGVSLYGTSGKDPVKYAVCTVDGPKTVEMIAGHAKAGAIMVCTHAAGPAEILGTIGNRCLD